jgi:hypothetical protein
MARPIYLFLYHVEFPYFANPPETKRRFETDLLAFLRARRLRCLMGQQGGMANTYGVVHRKRWGVKEADRIAVADWIKAQRICATVRLGRLEEDNELTDLCRDITECLFEVDNLTKADRKAAAAYERWTKNIGKRPRTREANRGTTEGRSRTARCT